MTEQQAETDGPVAIEARAIGLPDTAYTAVLLRDEEPVVEEQFTGTLALTHDDDLPPGRHHYRLEIRGPEYAAYAANTAPAFRARAWSSPVWVIVE